MNRKRISIIDAMEKKELFAAAFASPSWRNWKIFLKAVFALQMTEEELQVFRQFTGRQTAPIKQPREAFVAVGMGGGKTRIMSTVAVYLSAFRDYSRFLAYGQRAFVYLIATDKDQASEAFRYCEGLFDSIRPLSQLVMRKKGHSIHLKNRVTLEVRAANFRTVRGRTLVAVICDELAFWRSEGSLNPDKEILDALRPGLGRVPNSLLLAISSPHSKRGELWNQFRKHYGQDSSNVLFWKASTLEMNPRYDRSVIDEKYEEDSALAASQYGGEFRSDLESFVSAEVVDACVIDDRFELPALQGKYYVAFFDGSGGMHDSFALAIAHFENEVYVLDLIREVKPPCNTESVIAEFAVTIKQFGTHYVIGDAYAGQSFSQLFQKYGVSYKFSEFDKSALYRNLWPLLNSGRVELLNKNRLILQLCNLERRTRSGSKGDVIDHPVGQHDDVINAVAGAVVSCASSGFGGYQAFMDSKVPHGRTRQLADENLRLQGAVQSGEQIVNGILHDVERTSRPQRGKFLRLDMRLGGRKF